MTKVGDVFAAKMDENTKKYLQYVASDSAQLNIDVIRTFKKRYFANEDPSVEDVIKDEVDFYAHCVTKWGIKLGYWEKVGNKSEVGGVNMLFRSTGDSPRVDRSDNWWIWK